VAARSGIRHARHKRTTDSNIMSRQDNDPVPPGLWLDLDEAFRVLETLEDSLLALEEADLAP